MLAYIFKRLLLVPITLLAIIIVNFTVIQFAPGGPVEQTIAKIQGVGIDATARISGSGSGDSVVNKNQSQSAKKDGNASSVYRGARGLDPELIKEIERSFGFDKPVHERFILMIKNYLVFDFGESYFKDRKIFLHAPLEDGFLNFSSLENIEKIEGRESELIGETNNV